MVAATGFAGWAIAIVLLVVISIMAIVVYIFVRKRVTKSRASVGAQEDVALEKSISSSATAFYPVKPLTAYNSDDYIATEGNEKDAPTNYLPVHSRNDELANRSNTGPASPATAYRPSVDVDKLSGVFNDDTVIQLTDPFKEDTTASSISTNVASLTYSSEDQHHYRPSKTKDFKIDLPLPPPSSSFFADKMELNSDEADELYRSYFSISTQQQGAGSEGNIDDSNNTMAFLSAAAASIQQKAATIRSNLRQSIRRKSLVANKAHVPLNQMFSVYGNGNNTTDNQNRSSSTVSTNSHKTTGAAACNRSLTDASSVSMSRRQSSSTTVSAQQQQPRNSLQGSSSVFTASSSNHLLTPPIPPAVAILSDKSSTSSSTADFQDSRKLSIISATAKHYLPSYPYQNYSARREADEHIEDPNSSNKIMIDDEVIPSVSQHQNSTPPNKSVSSSVQQPSVGRRVENVRAHDSHFERPEDIEVASYYQSVMKESEETAATAASAARKVIRSASRKSRKTRSMIVDPAVEPDHNINQYPAFEEHSSSTHRDEKSYPTSYQQQQRYAVDSVRALEPSSPTSSTVMTLGRAFGKSNNSNKRVSDIRTLNSVFTSPRSSADPPAIRDKAALNKFNTLAGRVEAFESSSSSDTIKQSTASSSKKSTQSAINSSNEHYIEPSSPNESLESSLSDKSSKFSTLQHQKSKTIAASNNNNVDTIRKMLQASWSNNEIIKESDSLYSLESSTSSPTQTAARQSNSNKSNNHGYYMDSLGSTNSFSARQITTPIGSLNPRMQNKHLVSLSLRLNNPPQQQQQPLAARSGGSRRPAMPAAFYLNNNNNTDMVILDEMDGEGPMPTASFSSSTVRTMIPEDELNTEQRQETKQQKPKQQSTKSSVTTSGKSVQEGKKKKNDNSKKTPAQQEREKYLRSLRSQS